MFRKKKQLEMKFVWETARVQQVSHHEKCLSPSEARLGALVTQTLIISADKPHVLRSHSLVLGIYLRLLLFKTTSPHFTATDIID